MGESLAESTVHATVATASFDSGDANRDAHVRGEDFFDVEKFPEMTFRGTSIEGDGEDYTLTGDLTIKGITKPVVLETEVGGFGPDAYGGYRAGFSAKTEISRKEFGVDIEMPLEAGGVVVGDAISISIDIEAVLQAA